jgi:hypothetical protein
MELKDKATLKLPQAFDGLTINVWSELGIGPIRILQSPAEYIDGGWILDVVLKKYEPFPRLVKKPKKAG